MSVSTLAVVSASSMAVARCFRPVDGFGFRSNAGRVSMRSRLRAGTRGFGVVIRVGHQDAERHPSP